MQAAEKSALACHLAGVIFPGLPAELGDFVGLTVLGYGHLASPSDFDPVVIAAMQGLRLFE
ncbi:hypothetical protein CO608_04860 [Lysobacteraceae bacterium NML08-0793]|nr:hypothetical protein CO608_04860 [Xanthomonadaceae bacterium NML08-0793]